MLTAIRTTLPATADQVRVARHWLAAWLGEEHPATYPAVLLLSEVFGNSVQHAASPGAPVHLLAERTADHVRVELTDAGGQADPVPDGSPSLDAESGRGLFILDQLAKDWGWHRLPDTRLRLWFTLSL